MKKLARGFTLIELLITMITIAILSGILFVIIFQSFQAYLTARDLSNLTAEGQFVLTKIKQDVRNIDHQGMWLIGPSLFAWLEPPPTANATTIRGYGENPSGTISRYRAGWHPVVDDIVPGSFRVTYLATDGVTPITPATTSPAPNNLYYITVSFTLRHTGADGHTYTIPLSTTIFPRRLR